MATTNRSRAHALATALWGNRRYPTGVAQVAQRILDDPKRHAAALANVSVLRHLNGGEVQDATIATYQVIQPHKHDWRYAWGLLVCANEPCPDYGQPGLKPWPSIPNWRVSDPKTYPRYEGTDPEVIERHRLEDEEDKEDEDDD